MTEESSHIISEAQRLDEIWGTETMIRMWQQPLCDEVLNARVKHGTGKTPQNPDMSDADKLAILVSEVGEVAEAIGYRHRKNLKTEVLQVATMALLWYDSL